VAFDLHRAWKLNPAVAIRPEPFGALVYHFDSRRLSFLKSPRLVTVVRLLDSHASAASALEAAGVPARQRATTPRRWQRWPNRRSSMRADAGGLARPTATPAGQFKGGLATPICLTWERTYACNLSCMHCLSSSSRRDPAERATAEMHSVVDELRSMQVFYINVAAANRPCVRRGHGASGPTAARRAGLPKAGRITHTAAAPSGLPADPGSRPWACLRWASRRSSATPARWR
jgi:putative mycofactocin binding protein MftB